MEGGKNKGKRKGVWGGIKRQGRTRAKAKLCLTRKGEGGKNG